MAITAYSGPLIAFGTYPSTGSQFNNQRGPSLSDCADGFLDPRVAYSYAPGSRAITPVFGFYNNQGIIDLVLSSASSNAFCVSSATQPVSGTALTITPSTAKDTKTTTITAPENGTTVSVTCIGSTTASLTFGSDGTVNIWNPAGAVARCVSITASSSGDAGNWTIIGRDAYGYKVTELVPTSTGTATSLKAYKYISSIIAATTIASTGVSVGLADTIGFPLYAPNNGGFVQVFIVSSNSSASGSVAMSTATFTPGSTVTQTSTTSDVRGTYASTTASNGTRRFQIFVTPTPAALQSVATGDNTGLFGQAQYSSV